VTAGSRPNQGRDQRGDAPNWEFTTSRTTIYCSVTVRRAATVPGMVRDLQRSSATRPGPRSSNGSGACPTRWPRAFGGGLERHRASSPRFVADAGVRLVGYEAGGDGIETGRHAATNHRGNPGVLHGARSYCSRTPTGRRSESHIDLSRAGLSGRRPRALLPARHRPGRVPPDHRRPRRGRLRAAVPHRRASSRRSSRRMHWPGCSNSAVSWARTASILVNTVRTRRQGRRDGVDLLRAGAVMTALSDQLAKAKADGRAALIGYLPVGYPSVDIRSTRCAPWSTAGPTSLRSACPTSDPVMDGPVIQAAAIPPSAPASALPIALRAVAAVAETGRRGGRNVVLEPDRTTMGIERFAADLAAAGGSGAITPDLIPDEAAPWNRGQRPARPGSRLPHRTRRPPDARIAFNDRRLPRLRLCGIDHGRDRHPRPGRRRRATAGRPAPAPPRQDSGLRLRARRLQC